MEGLDSTSFPENWLSLKPNNTTDIEEDDWKVILRLGSPRPFINRPMNRSSTHEANENRSTCRSFRSEELAKCPVCSRSFESMKAMHGHMRSHPERGWRGVNPPPPPPPSDMTASSSSTTTSTRVLSPPPIPIQWITTGKRGQKGSSKHAAVKQAHECRTCGKSFPTGQALGGHQTIHRPKPPQAAAPPLNNNANPRPVLDFNLNHLPPIHED